MEAHAVLGQKKRLSLNSISFGLFNLWKDQRGTVAITGAISITVLFGFAALAIDAASWQTAQKSMQGAADMAAYSAGIAQTINDGTSIVTQAKGITAAMGYVDGQNGVTVTVNQPPKSGNYTSEATAIEVIIQQPQAQFFSGLFLPTGPTVKARAVANLAGNTGCILALDPSANAAINISGSGAINSPNCNVVANSTSSNAINMSGSATINAKCLVATGNVKTTSGVTETCAAPQTGVAPTADPYASVPAPTPSGSCLTVPGGSPLTLYPGNYCNGLSVGGGSVTFEPGVYYVNGNFALSGSTVANGSGVTFFLAGGNNTAISGSATVNFSAPTSGTYSGIVFFGDRTVTNGNNNFSGGTTSNIGGAIYFPTQKVTYSGGSSSGNVCTNIVAGTINISGQANLNAACSNTGMKAINVAGGGTPKVVE
jgi:Flp pilus assembly protein TadG